LFGVDAEGEREKEKEREARLRTNYPQAELGLERIEIPVSVQQRMPLLDAKRGNPAINGLAHGVATLSQFAIIPRCDNRQLLASGRENLEAAKFSLNPAEGCIIANALQDLA